MKITVDLTEKEVNELHQVLYHADYINPELARLNDKYLKIYQEAVRKAKTAIPDGEDETRC